MKMKKAKAILRNCIYELNECKDYFTTKPLRNFSRNGKLSFEQMIKSILSQRILLKPSSPIWMRMLSLRLN